MYLDSLDLLEDYPLPSALPDTGPQLLDYDSFDEFSNVRRWLPIISEFPRPPSRDDLVSFHTSLDLVDEHPHFHAPARGSVRSAVKKGEGFVSALASIARFSDNTEVPWTDELAEYVDYSLNFVPNADFSAFLVGVVRRLRAGKESIYAQVLASGFCVLAIAPPKLVHSALPGVDVSQTCEAV